MAVGKQDKPATEGHSTAPSIVSAPSPALPKGGGAIRGIGETFSANPVTGTGTLKVPIATSPGRGGFHPDLALAYDSGAGNGPFGIGWHLSVPNISRKTEKMLPQYRDAVDSDIFILSGAEDLVPSLVPAGSGWARDVPVDTATLRVERFRPRVEGLFARIERRTDKTSGGVSWVSITRDNIKSTYGLAQGAAGSQIADPARPERVFSWLLERTEDGKGNVIAYEYKAEDLAGVAPTLPEAHRLAGDAPVTANRYLKRIRYGNTTPGDASTSVFEIVFDYGEHDAAIPTPDEPQPTTWPARADAFSSYRPGFEVRTYRLCRRVLMFHRFAELGAEPCLVSSTDFAYAEEDSTLSRLVSVTHAGYLRADGASAYSRKTLPDLDFTYSLPVIQTSVQSLDPGSMEMLPGGVDGLRRQWVDLDGEGIPGALTEVQGALFYQRNLGAGRLTPPRRLPTLPAMTALSAGHQQLVDLAGEGHKDLVQFAGPMAGFHERTADDGWGPFMAFRSQPNIDWNDPSLHFIDLNGDGFDDLLLVKDNVFVWYPSEAKCGFGAPRTFPRVSDEEKGPALVFADPTHSIFLADLSGDGLVDLCRIRNGEVCYWPNLGQGRFGAKVAMARAPRFDDVASFDGRRIRLADIDGSGTTDVLYVDRDGPRFWLNQAGNGWGPMNALPRFGSADLATAAYSVVDLLGTGTGCLVWSSTLPSARPAIKYIDLLGSKKPHLLVGVVNNLGLETRMEYAPSTRFYLEDRAAGHPWVTRLSFPVQVLTRVETYDAVRRVRFVSLYTYHHGYFDGYEREFRGFGLVVQQDTESFSSALGQGLFPEMPAPVNGEYPLAPVVTKTWFHVGAWREGEAISQQFAGEYYAGDASAWAMPDSVVPDGLSVAEIKQACRALKGQVLRQEVYSLDGSAAEGQPYSVSERRYEVRLEQPAQEEIKGAFFAHPRESLEYHYERNPADPRVGHSFTLEVDAYGDVVRSAAVGYPRRVVPAGRPEQGVLAITCTESDFAAPVDGADAHRVGVTVETRTFELTLASPPVTPLTAALSFEQIHTAATTATPLPYEGVPTAGLTQKRLIERAKTRYCDSANLPAPLAFGQVDALALSYESYGMAFTPSLLAALYAGRVTAAFLQDGGYVDIEGTGDAWVPSGRQEVDPAQFYLPVRFIDPFAHVTTVTYDAYGLLVTAMAAPLGNTVQVDNDYRTLGPSLVTDPNGNRGAVAVDELGLVVATAVMGKVGSADGDTLSDPTTKLEYAFYDAATGLPSYAHVSAREQHGVATTRWQESYTYSDGSGHEVMKKVQAEPGPILNAAGTVLVAEANPRWVGTGRTVINNKGLPIKQYEPFFSATNGYETDAEMVERGVTPLLTYDALGRLIRTDFPNGTCSRVEFTPWEHTSWDVNDTVLDAGNLWYAARQPGAVPAPSVAEQRAATLAAKDAGTPSVTVFDALGRPFLSVADNGGGNKYETRTTLDIEGNPLVITDARGKAAMTQAFSMLGQQSYQKSIDAGERWSLGNVLGKPFRVWDGLGRAIRSVYDELNRPTELRVAPAGGSEALAERTVYGEGQPAPEVSNLRGKPYQQYDGAGLVTNDAYDFKGNLLSGTRQLAIDYTTMQLDWSASPAPVLDPDGGASFTTATTYDALNRVTSQTAPDGSVTQPTYNEAGLLEQVAVLVRGATPTVFVANIDYDEKGLRQSVLHGNGVLCEYAYDPLTFRLVELKTTRGAGGSLLQNLGYTYDPVGNITEISDGAQQTVFFANDVVSPSTAYVYDALYRLIQATGREQAGGLADVQRDLNDVPVLNLPNANDMQAVRNYTESYAYDAVGNFLQMGHAASSPMNVGTWTRYYQIDPASNRLLGTSAPGDVAGEYSAKYGYDVHGNMTSMPHLASLGWDFKNQMRAVDLEGGGAEYYVYDAGGQRIRKVWEHSGLVEEWIYVGGFEVYRKRQGSGGGVVLERETLHVMDGTKRVAMVETKTVDATVLGGLAVTSRIRYQMGNHLGSVALELDETGLVISYEEYHPYGTSAYRAAAGGVEVSAKRYRYTGKERDEETGLYYHGARYYAPWLGRWTTPDPIGPRDSTNLYEYVTANPTRRTDSTGTQCDPEAGSCPAAPEPAVCTSVEVVEQASSETGHAADQMSDDSDKATLALKEGGVFVDDAGRPLAPATPAEGKKLVAETSKALQQTETPTYIGARDAPQGIEQIEEADRKHEAEVQKDLPGPIVSSIPVVGSGWTSAVRFAHGDYARGVAYGAMAISDLALAKSAGVGIAKLAAKAAGTELIAEGGASIVYRGLAAGENPVAEVTAEGAAAQSAGPRLIHPRALRVTEELSSKNQAVKMSKLMGGDKGFGPFNPIDAVETDGELYIVDGHHRAAAAIKARLAEVPVLVREPFSASEAQDLVRDWAATLNDRF